LQRAAAITESESEVIPTAIVGFEGKVASWRSNSGKIAKGRGPIKGKFKQLERFYKGRLFK
jgi:hypothetical protein